MWAVMGLLIFSISVFFWLKARRLNYPFKIFRNNLIEVLDMNKSESDNLSKELKVSIRQLKKVINQLTDDQVLEYFPGESFWHRRNNLVKFNDNLSYEMDQKREPCHYRISDKEQKEAFSMVFKSTLFKMEVENHRFNTFVHTGKVLDYE